MTVRTARRTLWLAFLVACGPADGEVGEPSPDPAAAGGLFETVDAEGIRYRTGPGMGYCLPAGELVRFELDPGTREVTAAVAEEGDRATDDCLHGGPMGCVVEREETFTLTREQYEGLVRAIDAVPAPMCERNTRIACDPCLVETLEVGEVSVGSTCCGEQRTEGYGEAFDAVVEAMLALVPAG